MAEKTEQATPKKLRDARKKGQVAKSQDFPSAFTFVVSIATVLVGAGYIYEVLASYMISLFKMISGNIDLQNRATGIFTETILVIFNASFPVLVVTSLVGLLIHFLTVGPVFSIEAMKPDLKRLNPVTNIKNLFKFKTLFELLKSILKITGALILIYSVMWNSLTEIVSTAALSVVGSAHVFVDFLVKVIIRIGIFFLAIAIFDLIFQRRTFSKEMMMEKFEVKQEYRDTEGDPQMKSRRRQTAQEIAYQEGVQSIKRAKAVITNPTHIAVAIEYDPNTQPAPRILTMGKELIADTIIRIAQELGIPIMRNVTLAQTLFEKGKISEYVPEETYQAIAEILRWLEGIEVIEKEGLEIFK
jgi:type III secretion protein U